jgi:hypothetical protein
VNTATTSSTLCEFQASHQPWPKDAAGAPVGALTVGDGEGEEAVCPPQAVNATALTTMAVSHHVDFTV